VVAWGVDYNFVAIYHSTHQENMCVMHGKHLEGPHLDGSLLCATQVDMGPWYNMYIDSIIA
jgi:hypothetical protein